MLRCFVEVCEECAGAFRMDICIWQFGDRKKVHAYITIQHRFDDSEAPPASLASGSQNYVGLEIPSAPADSR